LAATQLLSRVEKVVGATVPLRVLFEEPTISGLAQAMRSATLQVPSPPIVPLARTGPLPLSFGQERLWAAGPIVAGHSALQRASGGDFGGSVGVAVVGQGVGRGGVTSRGVANDV
jgi:hypothetical protein